MRLPLRSVIDLAGLVAQQSLSTVDAYAAKEIPAARAGLLANIGHDGGKSHGALPGLVVASPSTQNPNYLYTWTRDSSLVFKPLVDQVTSGEDPSLRSLVDSFITVESKIQQTSNPSGTVTSGGLGEPKFNIDGTAFTLPWGRPQRDGPALRSTTMMAYGNWLLDHGNTSFVQTTLWPIIQLDLDYVAQNWNKSTFDLWEEVNSSSFFTAAVQHRSLREGSAFASRLEQGNLTLAYTSQADRALCFMQSFWNPKRGYITANTGGGRSGIDANTVLASIHTFDPSAGCDATTFQPCSDKALANLVTYIEAFRSTYPLNSNASTSGALATGRYPEDTYYGGNPWYLSIAAVSEQLYDAYGVWANASQIEVTSISLPFFRRLLPNITIGTYASGSSVFTSITAATRRLADDFLALHAKYTPADGSLSEQFDRSTGAPKSAADLTWNYAALITAFRARDGRVMNSWGARGLHASC
ncbi:glycoside hydrolase family 15 protein [Auriscalpium vulgare]|uniref:Glycoside hydrolase family 15 protein n=1 Tax=Auriscalpium vulgare TaxID=40419 RepID=A0ACB8R8U1_9AGAM|nr:glycoside hydrolase family 15 protein [Auriscalpium vulgare]